MIALAKPKPLPEPSPLPAVRAGIPVWHFVISGFTQTLEHPSGCQNLWAGMRRARQGCEAPVLLEPWKADWAGLAELVWRFRPADRPPRVFCYAYSWGGGWGFPRLAGELARRHIEIEHAVLCDAVYRPRCRLLAPIALTAWPKIVVPPNVRQVDWFFQRTAGIGPHGQQVVAADPSRTRVNAGVEIHGVTHHYMDDESAWWLKCLEVAGRARSAAPFNSLLRVLDAA